eukprot:sb/3479216/
MSLLLYFSFSLYPSLSHSLSISHPTLFHSLTQGIFLLSERQLYSGLQVTTRRPISARVWGGSNPLNMGPYTGQTAAKRGDKIARSRLLCSGNITR